MSLLTLLWTCLREARRLETTLSRRYPQLGE